MVKLGPVVFVAVELQQDSTMGPPHATHAGLFSGHHQHRYQHRHHHWPRFLQSYNAQVKSGFITALVQNPWFHPFIELSVHQGILQQLVYITDMNSMLEQCSGAKISWSAKSSWLAISNDRQGQHNHDNGYQANTREETSASVQKRWTSLLLFCTNKQKEKRWDWLK